MPVYAIADVRLLNPALAKDYRELSQASIAKYGGRYIVRGGPVEVWEGEWNPSLMVVVEFPDMEKMRAWYASPEYARALKIREQAMDRNLIVVNGCDNANT